MDILNLPRPLFCSKLLQIKYRQVGGPMAHILHAGPASKLAGLRGHFRCAAEIPLFLHFHSLTGPLGTFFITMTPPRNFVLHVWSNFHTLRVNGVKVIRSRRPKKMSGLLVPPWHSSHKEGYLRALYLAMSLIEYF